MNAWLMIAADEREHGGNDGYDDDPASRYSWDDRVPNHQLVQAGDVIVLWDKEVLLGVSVIDDVTEGIVTEKLERRCPECRKTNLKARKSKLPKWRCAVQDCLHETDSPDESSVKVKPYFTSHAKQWVDLHGLIRGEELRNVCKSPRSQHAIRAVEWGKLVDLFSNVPGLGRVLRLLPSNRALHQHGHQEKRVRVRRGQAAFRKHLIEKYGFVCALSGKQHPEALDAAHLYSYADENKHHENGGMLLRKDLHNLFDRGYIAIDPASAVIDLADDLLDYPDYRILQGRKIQVSLEEEAMAWIESHWKVHRQ